MRTRFTPFITRAAITLLVMLLAVSTAWAKDYSGGELYTKGTWMYGKFEARMKMAAASGTVSSMFLYHNDSYLGGSEPWEEVDIEILGKNPNSFQSNIITGYGPGDGQPDRKVTSEKYHGIAPASDASFHTYGIEWTPDYVAWILDGQVVRKTIKGQGDNNQVQDLGKKKQSLRFNLWSDENAGWVGTFDDSKLPLFQFINWVKVYTYTPGVGPGGSDFTLEWTDNFDTFDDNRWNKGDWTSDGNRVDFTPNNIYCRDGMMILALTRKGQESFSGQVPIDVVAHPVTTTAGTDYWTTFYNNSYHFKADDNTTVYKATLNGSSLKLTEVADRIVTKGNAVILKSTGNPTMTATTTASTDGYAAGTNDLKGGSLSDPTNYDAYTLSRGSTGTGTLGFYKFNGSSLDGNKAHLEIAKTSPAPEFVGFGNDETSLTPSPSLGGEGSEYWYALDGRRISGKPTKKGVYVRNGQKVVIK